ncbi:HI0074 family nucleotidyltransferase substrate-binding subunit [Desulforudis sp. 1088]|uniref:HI0074 family nucleotidyltransferase substrate-binding subunit n=1 Tax=unclassified Candidatus Desulforudis TaxID=2635950 RepID=UPI00347E3E3F
MERVKERISVALRALETLEEVINLNRPPSPIERDAAIQRFEYTFEAAWKAAQGFLREFEGIDVGSPKGVLRASFRVGLLTEDSVRLGLEMADDRNRTVHTYNAELAETIYKRLSGYASLMRNWLKAMAAVSDRTE